MTKKYVSALLAGTLASFLLIGTALAQRPEGIPEGVGENGPDEAAIMREVRAPSAPTGDVGPAVERPAIPGIPAAARSAVADGDLVEVFCLMTKWKSGKFFAALAALEKHLIPAIASVEEITGPLDAPGIAAIRAEAEGKLDAVCRAATPEEAQAATESLAAYGEEARARFVSLRDAMSSKLQAKGDELRARVESRVRALADEEKANAQAELNAYGESLGAEAQSALEKEMAGKEFSSGEAAEAYVNSRMGALRAGITSKVQAKASTLKSGIESRIRAAADEAAGPDKAKFQALDDKLGGLGGAINAAIAAGEGQYDSFREQAMAKRQALVLAVVDQNIIKAKAELEKNRAQIEEARAENPEIKSVEGVLGEMEADRAALASAVAAALTKDDEGAFQAAIDGFQKKWEGYRGDMEKAFFSPGAICAKAAERLGAGRARMDEGMRQVAEVQSRCAGSVSDECVKVNELAPRFAAMSAKMGEVNAKLSAIEAACRDEASTDAEALLAMLAALKTSGEDLETYGKAFEAEKGKLIADSAASVCSQVLPQLKAARVELQKDDLGSLKANLDRCRGEKTEECAAVNAAGDAFKTLQAESSAFLSDAGKLEALCGQALDETRFLELRDLANFLKARGDSLKSAAKELKVKQSEKASQKAVCASVKPRLEGAKQEITRGLADARKVVASCSGKTDERCAAVTATAGRVGEVTGRAENTLGRVVSVLASCGRAADGPVDGTLLAELAAIRSEEGAIKELVAMLKAEDNSPWPARIKSGKPFKVVLDEAPKKFDDSKWTGDWRTDQMGTVRGGGTYTLTYGAGGWAATGLNEGTGRAGTWTYRSGNPDDYQVDIWGRIYKFDRAGLVYDPDFGLVGHLAE